MLYEDFNNTRGIIIQARVGSSRLPRKIFLNLCGEESVLEFLHRRLSQCKTIHKLIVATSLSSCDDVLSNWLTERKILYFRGEEQDCLKRIADAASAFEIDTVVRITADCPLIAPEIVDSMMNYYLHNVDNIDYLSNRQFTNYPEGVDVEIFTQKMLREANTEALLPEEREHLNYFFLNRPDKYRIRYFNHNLGNDYSRFKLSIDTADDLERVQSLFVNHGLGRNFSFEDLLATLEGGSYVA